MVPMENWVEGQDLVAHEVDNLVGDQQELPGGIRRGVRE